MSAPPLATAAIVAAAVLAVSVTAGAGILARLLRRAECAASSPVRAATDPSSGDPAGWPPADALVVFGATVYEYGPCAELRARLDHALALWRMGVAPVVMVGGGVCGGIDEVEAMTDYLVAWGIPDDAVVPVRPGDNTRTLLRTLGLFGDRRYVAVSSPYHALRIRAEARRQGLRVAVSAPPSTPETRHGPTYRARFASEMIALVWYALPPDWTARVRTGSGTMRHAVPRILAGRVGSSARLTQQRRRSS